MEATQVPIDSWIKKSVCVCVCVCVYACYWNIQFSRSIVSDSLRPHELQHAWNITQP